MTTVVTAPADLPVKIDLFLAGGISGCGMWQDRAVELLGDAPVTVVNPRRSENISLGGPDGKAQIAWERRALKAADAVLFWFPAESLCPIALLELGVQMERPAALFVGTSFSYARRFDVIEQLALAKPGVSVRDNLEEVVADYLSSLRDVGATL